MFGWRKPDNLSAVGIAGDVAGTAIAVIEGAAAQRPRVLLCAQLDEPATSLPLFCKEHGLQNAACVDVLPPASYGFLQIDVQGLKQDERRETARWQIREFIDYPAEEAVLDLIEVPVAGNEESFRTFAVAAPREMLKERIKLFKQLALHLKVIDIPEFALRNLLELYQNEPRGLGLLWVRADNSLLIITRGETFFFSRLINCGMNQLAEGAPTDASGFLSERLQTQLDGIVLEIQRSLDYCEGNFRLPPVPKIMVSMCGNESQEILDYLDHNLQAAVVPTDLREVLDLPLEIDPSMANDCLLALGAALRAGGRE